MHKVRLVLTFLLCLLTLNVQAQAEDAEQQLTVTIGVVADNEPYSSAGPAGPRGLSIDLLDELGRITGIRFDYRLGSWSEIYAAFLRGELDAIDEISWREDRADKMLFTRPYHIRQTVIMHDAGDPLPPVHDLSDLDGYRVGILRDIYYRDAFTNAGVNVREYDLLPNLVRALAFGWVDAIVGPELTLSYLARRDGFPQLQVRSPAPLAGQASEDFRLAVLNDRPVLHARLDQGLAAIDPQWLESLRERWQEYGGRALEAGPGLHLSPDAQSYIRDLGPLRVGLMDAYAPFSFVDGGRVQGLSVDYLARIADLTGLQLIPVADDWTTLMELFRRGEIDLLANMSDLPARRAFTRFSQTYHEIPIVAFSNEADFRYTGSQDLAGLRVGFGEGVFYAARLQEIAGDNAIPYRDHASMFRALAEDRIDLVISSLPSGNHWVRELNLNNVWVAGALQHPDMRSEDLRFGVRPGLARLVPVLDQALTAISPTERRTIGSRWLGTQLRTASTPAPVTALSDAEQAWLDMRQRHLRFCLRHDRMPLEGISRQGEHQGLSAALLALLGNRLELAFEAVPVSGRDEALDAMREGRCDLVPLAITTPATADGVSFSRPWYTLPNVVLGRIEAPFISSLGELGDRPLGSYRAVHWPHNCACCTLV